MGKIKKIHSSQNLSPENYIRQRARNLPIYRCYVNSNWEENGMAQVLISRKHAGNTITFGIYLVDLFCLGLKDTLYQFNIPLSDFENTIEEVYEDDFEMIDYPLAHNIIYAA